jgi:hypothetical protein
MKIREYRKLQCSLSNIVIKMPLRDQGVLLKWLIECETLNWLRIGTVMTEIEFMFHDIQTGRIEHVS